jgi:Amt family ammonium transporter
MQNWPVALTGVVCLAVVIVSLAVLYARMLPASPLWKSLSISAGVTALGATTWFVLVPVALPTGISELFGPIGMLAGLATLIATIAVRSTGASSLVTLVFAFAWSLLVFVPIALGTFVTGVVGVMPLDHGGSVAVNVAGGAATLGVLLAAGPSAPRLRASSLARGLGSAAVFALVIGWLGWLVAAELAIDEVSGEILLNGALGGAGGIVGWLAVQRIRHQSTTLAAVSAGLVSGLVAVTAGAPLLSPVAAASSGILAGGAACIFTLRRVGASRRQQWFIVGSHLIAGAVGIVLIGLLATDSGFLFTGQVGIIQDQVISTVAVAMYSAVISFLLWLLLSRISRHGSRARS